MMEEEKKEIRTLNERLSALIGRFISTENEKNASNVQEKLQELKNLYEQKLSSLRSDFDTASQQVIQIQSELLKEQSRKKETETTYKQLFKRYKDSEKEKEEAEKTVLRLKEKLVASENQIISKNELLEKLHIALEDATQRNEELRLSLDAKHLELSEAKLRLDSLEKKCHELSEDNKFNNSLSYQEVELLNSSIVSNEAVERSIYNELQKSFEENFEKLKREAESEYVLKSSLLQQKVSIFEINCKKERDHLLLQIENKDAELRTCRETIEKLTAHIDSPKSPSIQSELMKYKSLLDIGEKRLSDSTVKRDCCESIIIADVDKQGRFITIKNNSQTPTDISFWRLCHANDAGEGNVFKFRRNTIILPGAFLTVWAKGNNVTSDSNNFIMKTQTWVSGESTQTMLVDCNFTNINIYNAPKSS